MSTASLFKGVIHKGRFIPDDWPRYARALQHYEGKRCELTLGKERKQRSDSQLAYYWGVLIRAIKLEVAGDEYDAGAEQDIHEHLLREVLVPMIPERFLRASRRGRSIKTRPTTGVLSHEEMGEYIKRCKDYAYATWGVHIPDRDHVVVRRPH